MTAQQPIACDISSISDDKLDQHRQNAEAIFKAIKEIREIENGFTFRLPADTELIQTVSSFVARERLCCPFFDFTLFIRSQYEPIWLQLSGREGVKSYIKDTILPKLDAPVKKEKQHAEDSLNPDTKVSDLLEQYPETYNVFRSYGCPDMRKGFFSLMARLMSIRNAARIHRISLDDLMVDLKKATNSQGDVDG